MQELTNNLNMGQTQIKKVTIAEKQTIVAIKDTKR